MADPHAISQEADRIQPKPTLGVTAAVVVFGCLLCGAAYWLLMTRSSTLSHGATARSAEPVSAEVHGVRSALFRGPAAGELRKQHQRDALRRYAWVDRERGIVKIPIDVAMTLEVAESESRR